MLAGLESRSARRNTTATRLLFSAAACLIVVSLLAVGYGFQRQRAAAQAYQNQVEELRARYKDLLQEVATVRQEVSTPDTRLYLGGDESVDLVLDLSRGPLDPQFGADRRDIRNATWEH